MSALPVPQDPSPTPPPVVLEPRLERPASPSGPLAEADPRGDVRQPCRPNDIGWLEWLYDCHPSHVTERFDIAEAHADVALLLYAAEQSGVWPSHVVDRLAVPLSTRGRLQMAAMVVGPHVRRERLDREAMERVKADDERRHARGEMFWE